MVASLGKMCRTARTWSNCRERWKMIHFSLWYSFKTNKHNCRYAAARFVFHTSNSFDHYMGECLKVQWPGFPGGAVVENPPANAEDAGSSPGLGRSHMPRSGWAREPQLLSLHVWSLCSTTGEAAVVGGLRTAMRSGPRLPQLEKALAQKRRPNTAINKLKKIKKKKSPVTMSVRISFNICSTE